LICVLAKTRQNTPDFSFVALSFSIDDNVFHLFARSALCAALRPDLIRGSSGSAGATRCSRTQFHRADCSGPRPG
jgi:hypothetical protein